MLLWSSPGRMTVGFLWICRRELLFSTRPGSMSFAWSGSTPIRPLSPPALVHHCPSLLSDMNPNLLPPSLVTAVALLIAPQTSEATIYTFDVDLSSGIGTGSFSIDLPDSWPRTPGATVIPASSFRGFYARGDKWTALSVTLNVLLEPDPNNAELCGTSKKTISFTTVPSRSGIFPVDAVADLPGVTLRPIGVQGRQRRSPTLEGGSFLKAGWYQSRQKPRPTSGTLSTDRVVDPAALVLEYTCASPPLPRPPSPQDCVVPKSAAQQTSGGAPSRSVRSKWHSCLS